MFCRALSRVNTIDESRNVVFTFVFLLIIDTAATQDFKCKTLEIDWKIIHESGQGTIENPHIPHQTLRRPKGPWNRLYVHYL